MDRTHERYQYYVHGFEQSRRLRALKVWMSFKRYGTEEIGSWIDRNVDQAVHLYELVQQSDDFRAATKPAMSAICIRYTGAEMSEAESGRLHREVARKVEEGGEFWISTTVLKGTSYFRINPVNFRTRLEHMERLLQLLRSECRLFRL
jgi:glutamate/tyrosine decarboxylase-like PLP-dependent enzyme